jgi:hypothetical protein
VKLGVEKMGWREIDAGDARDSGLGGEERQQRPRQARAGTGDENVHRERSANSFQPSANPLV